MKFRAALFCVLLGWGLTLLVAGIYYLDGKQQLRSLQMTHLQGLVERTATDLDDRIRTRQQLVIRGAASLTLTPEELIRDAPNLISRFHYLKGMFSTAVLYDRNGVIVADYPHIPGRVGLSVAERGYFQRTRDTLTPQISEPFRAKTPSRRHVVVFSAPILTPDGRFAGMLAGSLELFSPEFFGELSQLAIGKQGYIVLVAQQSRRFLFHPDPAWVDHPIPSRTQAPALYRAVVENRFGVSEGALSRGEDGLAALFKLQSVNWVLGAAIPLHEAYLPLQRFTRTLLWIGLAMMLLLPLLAWLAMRKMLAPLSVLQQQLQHWQDPSTAGALNVVGSSELVEMANTLNALLAGRQAFELRLSEREAFFRALNDVSPLGVLVCDRQGEIRYHNQVAAQMLSVSGIGCNWLKNVDAAESSRLIQLMAEELTIGGLVQRRSHLSPQQGLRLLLELRLTLLDDAHCLVILLDVTQQDAEQQALAGERERALAILGSISDAVVLTNQCDEVEYLNLPAQALLGIKAGDPLGRRLCNLVDFRHPETGMLLAAYELDGLTAGTHVELDMETEDGEVRAVVLALSSVAAQGVMQGYRVYVLRDDAERRQREQEQRYQATHDALTGLLNRRALQQELSQLLEGGRLPAVTVAMLDLDYFKEVNDKGGHQAGDLMLQAVAGLLYEGLRDSDSIARMGGDEFALILRHCDEADGQQVLNQIRQRIECYRLAFAGQSFTLSASIGLTQIQSSDATPEEVLARADKACYAAKFSGRNRIATTQGELLS
ncbi:diguanylate cyclase domain-containing protein [Craterilacuibacter sinensis]|uniref:Diguanylate cyclase n=1 Tax=Craterilacuibacter sinensis TaxID=2686017 RepID=A0A845BF44_9NEIS|nr:diguanylate cyclase [Craterilacuibacter sinensis]MXR35387.1 diguanylate cyclase [Craterilacuibacter sinensis]RQW28639.1 diguanylate cyclase [Rhodobacteraceae bacterium CH30]